MSGWLDRVASEYGLPAEELTVWIERRWVRPEQCGAELHFDAVDRARLGMIIEFRRDLAIDDEAMPVVLDLIDRLHAARGHLRAVIEAVAALPESQRDMVLRRLAGEIA